MSVSRLAKIVMVLGLSAFAFMVTFNNITDYDSNFEFVKHVLSCSIPDDHIDPRRSSFFMARSVLRDIRDGVQRC